MAKGTTAVYLYCVVRAPRRPGLTGIPGGVPGATPPDAVRVAPSLWLIVSEVPLKMYDPAHLEPRLRDLDWVSAAAMAHESVVEYFSRRRGATVVPTKLFTMFSSIEKALDDVGGRRSAIERVMRRIAGCEEWGIRVRRVPGAAVAAAAGNGSRPKSGAAFLAARKEARDAAARERAAAVASADAAFARLRRHAKDAHRRDRGPEPGANPPILEAAFLVPAAKRTPFKAEARRQAAAIAAAGAEMTLTGPWPAYNFVNAAEERA
jgi:Gas vesicle synthesis protein GvpL/GvpF